MGSLISFSAPTKVYRLNKKKEEEDRWNKNRGEAARIVNRETFFNFQIVTGPKAVA